MQSTMLQSATLSPLPSKIGWGGARLQNPQLTQVDPELPLFVSPDSFPEILKYDRRNRELAYRDVVIAGKILQLTFQLTSVWNTNTSKLGIPYIPEDVLYNDPADAYTPIQTPGAVDHVSPSSVVYDSLLTDRQLYTRDLLLHDALALLSFIFPAPDRLITPVAPGADIKNPWSFAFGRAVVADISLNVGLSTGVIREPDQALADRDNALATFIAYLNLVTYNIYRQANRLYVAVDGIESREPEVYVLIEDSPTYRVWAAEPFLPNRLRLRYHKPTDTIQWFKEDFSIHIPQPVPYGIPGISPINPLVFPGLMGGQNVEVLASVPAYFDCQFWRQKAAQIKYAPVADITSYFTPDPSASALSPTLILGPSSNYVNLKFAGSSSPVFSGLASGNYDVYVQYAPTVTGKVTITTTVESQVRNVSVNVLAGRVDVFKFPLDLASAASTLTVSMQLANPGDPGLGSLTIVAVQIVNKSPVSVTPSLYGFGGWKTELVSRTGEGLARAYADNLAGFKLHPVFKILNIKAGQSITPYQFRVNNPNATGFTKLDVNTLKIAVSAIGGVSSIGSNVITGINTLKIKIGMVVRGPAVPAGTVVAAKTSNTVTLSIPGPNPNMTVEAAGFEFFSHTVGVGIILFPASGLPLKTAIISIAPYSAQTQGYMVCTVSPAVPSVGCASGLCVINNPTSESAYFSAAFLPPGLVLDPDTGVLSGVVPSGTPASPVSFYTVAVTGAVTDSINYRVRTFSLLGPTPNAYAWDSVSSAGWENVIRLAQETRLDQAFRPAYPADVGRLALVPDGLYIPVDEIPSNSYLPAENIPTIQTMQPWMLGCGVRVCDQDFDTPRLSG